MRARYKPGHFWPTEFHARSQGARYFPSFTLSQNPAQIVSGQIDFYKGR
jgi:hypothetical protein